jgi:NitT/TauT family transport system substrate-binding protein
VNTKTKFGISIGIIIAVVISSQSDNHGLFSNSESNTIKTVNNNNAESKTLRLGYFPNVNHAQAIIGLKNGDFQKIIEGNNTNQGKIKINEFVFSAGPSAIEALFGGQIDAAYVGPNPAISGYIASGGEGLRIVSGVASGGSVFIVRNDAGIESVKDLGGKKFASPQLGNTQDISLRKYLINNGFNTVENGGNVTVVPVSNADIVTLFLKKEIDGAWVPEPWATTLVNEANGKVFVDERDLWPPEGQFVTANIIVRTDYLKENPDVIEKLLEAHVNETLWINNNKEKAINEFNVQLKKLTGKTIPQAVLANAVTKLEFTYDPIKLSLIKDANDAYDLGLLQKGKERPNLTNIYDLTALDKVLAQKGLETISSGNIASPINTGNNSSSNGTSGDALSDIVT